jgi:hypothetical protein
MSAAVAEDLREFIMLKDLPEILPRGRKGGKIDPATIWRWANVGCGPDKAKLRVKVIGGYLYTKRAWLDEFLEQRSKDKGYAEPATPPRTLAKRKRDQKQTRKANDAALGRA